MADKVLGNKLRELRNSAKYTQQEVADLLGLKNKSTLGSWEVGKSEPDAITFLRLCNIYNVNDIMFEFLGIRQETFYLNDIEKRLLKDFREMSSQGQEYLLQASDLVKYKYKKDISKQFQIAAANGEIMQDPDDEFKTTL